MTVKGALIFWLVTNGDRSKSGKFADFRFAEVIMPPRPGRQLRRGSEDSSCGRLLAGRRLQDRASDQDLE